MLRPSLLSFCCLVLALQSTAYAQTAREWVAQADEHYASGRYGESADCYASAIKAGAESQTTFYNAACSAALAERSDQAFEFLGEAINHGWSDIDHLLVDTDLNSLHQDPRWEKTLEHCRQSLADYLASIKEPDLRAELLEMRRIDQAARRGDAIPELEDMGMMDVDRINTARMKEVITEHGWPGASVVGEDGARSAWLLVQHADLDPDFQRTCLDLMTAASDGEVSLTDVAYLTDRVYVNEGKKQIYGTQFWTVDGELVPRPMEDEANVEERRKAMGMTMTFKEYKAMMTGRSD